MKVIDREALQRALALAHTFDHARAEQLDAKLSDEPWSDVAAFAAYVCQCRALHLRPWERSPAMAAADDDGPAGQLLRRMLAAGLSRYEPDPLVALGVEPAL
jgi:hypothetical protein